MHSFELSPEALQQLSKKYQGKPVHSSLQDNRLVGSIEKSWVEDNGRLMVTIRFVNGDAVDCRFGNGSIKLVVEGQADEPVIANGEII